MIGAASQPDIAPAAEKQSVGTFAFPHVDLISLDYEATAPTLFAADDMQRALLDELPSAGPPDPIVSNGHIVSLTIGSNARTIRVMNDVLGDDDPFGSAATAYTGATISGQAHAPGVPDFVSDDIDSDSAVGCDSNVQSTAHTIAQDLDGTNAIARAELRIIRIGLDPDLGDVCDAVSLDDGSACTNAGEYDAKRRGTTALYIAIRVLAGQTGAGLAGMTANILDVVILDMPAPTVANQNACREKMSDRNRLDTPVIGRRQGRIAHSNSNAVGNLGGVGLLRLSPIEREITEHNAGLPSADPKHGSLCGNRRPEDSLPSPRPDDFEALRELLVDHDRDVVVGVSADAKQTARTASNQRQLDILACVSTIAILIRDFDDSLRFGTRGRGRGDEETDDEAHAKSVKSNTLPTTLDRDSSVIIQGGRRARFGHDLERMQNIILEAVVAVMAPRSHFRRLAAPPRIVRGTEDPDGHLSQSIPVVVGNQPARLAVRDDLPRGVRARSNAGKSEPHRLSIDQTKTL